MFASYSAISVSACRLMLMLISFKLKLFLRCLIFYRYDDSTYMKYSALDEQFPLIIAYYSLQIEIYPYN
jgi:hypothetical protein